MLEPTDASKSNNPKIPILRAMGFTDILDAMFSLYRRHFRLFLGIAAVSLFAELIGQLLIDFPRLIVPDFLRLALALVISIFCLIVSIGGIVVASAALYVGGRITARAALGRVRQRLFPLLGAALLWSLVVVVLAVTIVGIPFALYFAARWGFFVETLLLEGVSARDALSRSSELVRGMWWRVCGMLLAVYLLSAAIHAVFEISVGFILVLSGGAGEVDFIDIIEWATIGNSIFTPDDLILYIMITGVHFSLSFFTFPIWVIGVTLLYFNQRIQKEGFDIEMRANQEM